MSLIKIHPDSKIDDHLQESKVSSRDYWIIRRCQAAKTFDCQIRVWRWNYYSLHVFTTIRVGKSSSLALLSTDFNQNDAVLARCLLSSTKMKRFLPIVSSAQLNWSSSCALSNELCQNEAVLLGVTRAPAISGLFFCDFCAVEPSRISFGRPKIFTFLILTLQVFAWGREQRLKFRFLQNWPLILNEICSKLLYTSCSSQRIVFGESDSAKW